jgi:hypothetical protein
MKSVDLFAGAGGVRRHFGTQGGGMNRNTASLRPGSVPTPIIVISSIWLVFAGLAIGMRRSGYFCRVWMFSLAVARINRGYTRLEAVCLIALFERINTATHLHLKFRNSEPYRHVTSPLERRSV